MASSLIPFPSRLPARQAACAFSNRYAPEHLIVNVEGAEEYLPMLVRFSMLQGDAANRLRPAEFSR